MKIIFIGMILILAASSSAFAVSYTFNEWNYDSTIANYGTVTITKEANGDIAFTIAANTSLFQGTTATPLAWDKFYFNYDGTAKLDLNKFKFSDTSWAVTTKTNDYNVSSFGIFQDQTKGHSDINPLTFYYDTTTETIDVLDFVNKNADGNYFSGHLQRIASPATLGGSVFLAVSDKTPPVPEPSTLLLLGSGLLGLGFYSRRRVKK